MSILLDNVSFSYGSKCIFSSLSLSLENGVFYSVSAPSGFGKTTLFRLIAGLETPDSGSVRVEGGLSYMFQEDRLFPTVSPSHGQNVTDKF